ncbi:MAG TPA: OmpA family protein [Terriglobales bacterium]|nr:OmpA family protein [Terriglobales bacterium]
MERKWTTIVMSLAAVSFLTCASVFGASDEKAEVKGMIIFRTGETLTVKTSGGNVTVVLTDDTKTKDNKGLIGLRKEYMANTVLIPGLKVNVEGASDAEGRIVAKTITVDGDDLETAEMIQAGLHPTAQQVQENTERFSKLGEYDVKAEATVRFAVGSSQVSAEDKEQLKKLAQTAIDLNGYLIEVKGFADSSGDAIMNEKLSEDRAEAVVGYLTQQCNVPVHRIVAPGALGEYQPAVSNETQAGRAQNRRVEIKVLVNKGIAGS